MAICPNITALGLVTPPSAEPVTRDELKAFLRIDHTAEDALLDSLNVAARWYVEQATRRQCLTATYRMFLDRFPAGSGEIVLPVCPVQSVAVKYLDPNDVEQTIAATEYVVSDIRAEPVRIVPNVGKVWPTPKETIIAVRVEFVAGYGASAASVPDSIKTTIKLVAANWYENREASTPATLLPVPLAVDSLIAMNRWGDYVGG